MAEQTRSRYATGLGRRHDRDAVSLVLGLLVVAAAALVLLEDVAGVDLDLRWAGPVVLIVVGALGLLGSVRGSEHDELD